MDESIMIQIEVTMKLNLAQLRIIRDSLDVSGVRGAVGLHDEIVAAMEGKGVA